MIRIAFTLLFITASSCIAARPSIPLPSSCKQAILVIAPSWDASQTDLERCRRVNGDKWVREFGFASVLEGYRRIKGDKWVREFGPVPVFLGKRGLAWAPGQAHGQIGPQKQEGDLRSPAGIFKIGKLYTSQSTLPAGIHYPFVSLAEQDMPMNRQKPTTNADQPLSANRTRNSLSLSDPSCRYLLGITDPTGLCQGNVAFLHIRRGPNTPTSRDTALSEKDFFKLLQWLRADQSPYYILLPWEIYKIVWPEWKLPVQF